MSDLNDVWNINRPSMVTNSLNNTSFPRNQLGPSYAPYTQEDVSGVFPTYSGCDAAPYQPKNIYSTTLGMAPAIITPDYIRKLFSDEYFLKLLGEFMVTNNIQENFTTSNSYNFSNMFDIIFKIFVVFMIIIIIFKIK